MAGDKSEELDYDSDETLKGASDEEEEPVEADKTGEVQKRTVTGESFKKMAASDCEVLAKQLMESGFAEQIRQTVREQAELLLGDMASSSSGCDVATGAVRVPESGSRLMCGDIIDLFDPNDPETNVTHWLAKIDQLVFNSKVQ